MLQWVGLLVCTWCTETMSPSLTLRLLRTVLFMRILASSTVSSIRTMQTVSLRFLPCESR